MSRWIPRVRRPVRRAGAQAYLLLTLLSFAASVTLTRLALSLTGYPQLGVGGGALHIAHVLWGGLVLFAAALLPLIFANRWAYSAAAILAGLGMGLFIDEVGKFITQTNDYFFAPAAPIIYAFFLLSVLLYVQVRRPRPRDARAALYAALEGLEDVLDRDLEADERAALVAQLRYARHQAAEPDTRRLAETLLDYLAPGVHLAPAQPDIFERLERLWQAFETAWLRRPRLKVALVGALAVIGGVCLGRLAPLVVAARTASEVEGLVASMVAISRVDSAVGLGWFLARVALEGTVGVILLVAAVLLGFGRDRPALGLGYLGLLLSLTAVNLLVFYFDQFSTIALASAQFLVLLGLLHYQRQLARLSADTLHRTAEARER